MIANQTFRLSLELTHDPALLAQSKRCRPLNGTTVLVMRPNETLTVKAGVVRIVYAPTGGGHSVPLQLPPNKLSRSVVALAGPLRLLLVPLPGTDPRAIVVCGPTQSTGARSG
jgi:hypothetical protein